MSIIAATSFATIVGLITQFKSERRAAADDEYQELLLWLENKHHNSVIAELGENHLLSSSIQNFLKLSHEEVVYKLDSLSYSITEIASQIEDFRDIASAAGIQAHPSDQLLFKKFLNILGSDTSSVYLLKNHDFCLEYCEEDIRPLFEFERLWGNAEYRFVNQDVDEAKENLRKVMGDFRSAVVCQTGLSSRASGWWTLIPDKYCTNHNRPKWLEEIIAKANDLAGKTYSEHQSFIRICREKIPQL